MLRLTLVSQTTEETVLKVEGWVTEVSLPLLEAEGERRFRESERLVLDLKGMRFIDPVGLALLKRWTGKRLVLRDGSPFVRELLHRHGLDGAG